MILVTDESVKPYDPGSELFKMIGKEMLSLRYALSIHNDLKLKQSMSTLVILLYQI